MSHYDEGLSVGENQARALFAIAEAISSLLYAFKYSKGEGMSVAEAIEVVGNRIAESVASLESSSQ